MSLNNMQLKIPYQDFVEMALDKLKLTQPTIKPDTIAYMKRNECESDSTCYEIPDYITIKID